MLPVVLWRSGAWKGGLLGAWIGANTAYFSGQDIAQGVPTVLFAASGGAALSLVRLDSY